MHGRQGEFDLSRLLIVIERSLFSGHLMNESAFNAQLLSSWVFAFNAQLVVWSVSIALAFNAQLLQDI
jgi:hypothetical protein